MRSSQRLSVVVGWREVESGLGQSLCDGCVLSNLACVRIRLVNNNDVHRHLRLMRHIVAQVFSLTYGKHPSRCKAFKRLTMQLTWKWSSRSSESASTRTQPDLCPPGPSVAQIACWCVPLSELDI